MVITPLVAAIIVGSFWTGVGATAVISQSEAFDRYDTDAQIIVDAEVSSDHITLCEAKYRSYDAETDMYLSFGGEWKRCVL